MDDVIRASLDTGGAARTEPRHLAEQAYQLLHFGFVALPAIAGADKFFHLLTNWDQYLAPELAWRLPMSGHTFMFVVGAIELLAAVVVAIRPRIGAYVVAAWLGAIVVQLVASGAYYDVALRDVGLLLGAIALGRLSALHEPVVERAATRTR